ncbi:MAG: MaoC family dehydratase [Candidatus Dormiibacterota bacterium]
MPADAVDPLGAHWGPEIDLFWEDLQPGAHFELGSHLVSQGEIIAFAKKFDPQPFHTDPAKAVQSIFGGLIASGWHSASIWMRLYFDAVLSHAASLGSPGVNELRWLNPVHPGDQLTGSVEAISARLSKSRPERGLVELRGELRDQTGEVKLRLTAWGLFGRRSLQASG